MWFKNFFTLSLLILCYSTVALAIPAPFIKTITTSSLKQIKDAENFTTLLYSAVLTEQQLEVSGNKDYQLAIGELFFTPPLFGAYKKDYEEILKTGEEGCINHRVFLNSQEIIQNFWVGKITLTKTNTLVPVYLGVRNEGLNTKIGLMLHLVLTTDGWRIEDISDLDLKNSLNEQLQTCLKQ